MQKSFTGFESTVRDQDSSQWWSDVKSQAAPLPGRLALKTPRLLGWVSCMSMRDYSARTQVENKVWTVILAKSCWVLSHLLSALLNNLDHYTAYNTEQQILGCLTNSWLSFVAMRGKCSAFVYKVNSLCQENGAKYKNTVLSYNSSSEYSAVDMALACLALLAYLQNHY